MLTNAVLCTDDNLEIVQNSLDDTDIYLLDMCEVRSVFGIFIWLFFRIFCVVPFNWHLYFIQSFKMLEN